MVLLRSIVVLAVLGKELQLDSTWHPPGDGDSGGSSAITAMLRLTAGVTVGSLHAKVQRFLMIFGLGHGSLAIHSSKSLAKALADLACCKHKIKFKKLGFKTME